MFGDLWCCSGQNVLHVLGQFGKENAAAIFDLIMECRPQLPVDQLDVNGNTGIYRSHSLTLASSVAVNHCRWSVVRNFFEALTIHIWP